MLDLGPLLLPNVPGLEVHLDLDVRTGNGKSVSLHLDMSIVELQVFAAATNEDLWGDMRNAIAAGLREQDVDCQVVEGRFGTEVRAVMPTVDLDGNAHVQPVRFVGIRGSRWFLRGVISGTGAIATSQIPPEIDNVIAQIVVHRGSEPQAPGERLWLRSPTAVLKSAAQTPTQDHGKYGHVHISL
jgi:hypothetical protein